MIAVKSEVRGTSKLVGIPGFPSAPLGPPGPVSVLVPIKSFTPAASPRSAL